MVNQIFLKGKQLIYHTNVHWTYRVLEQWQEEPVLRSFDFEMIGVVIVIWLKDVAYHNAELSEVQKSSVRSSWPSGQ